MLRKIVRRSASAPSQSQCLQFGFTQEAVPQEETCFFSNPCSHMSLNPWCHRHGHECRILSSWAMAVASCVVVVDPPVRQVFLLQVVHCIAAWLCIEACYSVLRQPVTEIRLLHSRRMQQEELEGARWSEKKLGVLFFGWRILASFFLFGSLRNDSGRGKIVIPF